MARFHINPKTGDVGPCRARTSCPFGDMETEHYGSREEAQAAYEAGQAKKFATKVGSPVTVTGVRPLDEAVLVSRRGKSGVAHELRSGYHYHIKLTDDGWTTAAPRGTSDPRILNPGKRPAPTRDSLLAGLTVPEGFTLSSGTEESGWGDEPPANTVTLSSPDVTIKMVLHSEGDKRAYYVGSGHVYFESSKGRRTFDKRGINDSFDVPNPERWYRDEGDPLEHVNAQVKEFLEERIPQARARIDGSEQLPGTRILVGAAQKQELLEKGSLTVRPAGMGQGHIFRTSPSQWAREASREQKDFFGVDKLWVENFDND